jgi:hypothetical protein
MTESRHVDPEEDAFNHVEMMSRVKQEVIKMTQEREKLLSMERNKVIEEVALRFERARDGCSPDDIMGRRWMDSAAELVRGMKR